MMDVEDSKSEIDESLYSRQLYVMGHEAQRRMAGSSVLIVGLNGLGVEAAKNVILSGVKKVAILDDYPTKYEDLSSQFYLSEVDIGHSRAQMSYAKLAELNPYVEVSLLQGELTESKMKDFNVIVLIDQSHKTQLEVSDYCHANNIAFIIGDTRGVFGMIFCDFGENFVVSDTNGEQAASSIVASITQDYPALVTCLEETRHNLESGDTITLTGLVGMEELNNRSFVVTKKDLFSFEIMEDTRGYSAYVRGGYVNQVKTPVTLSFSSLRTSLEAPGEFVADFNKFDAFNTTHLAWRALHAYRETFGEFPKAGSKADAKTLLDIAYRMNKESSGFKVDEEELQRNESVITNMAVCARGQVSPMCSALGGILGQEILKASSGKFMPIKQWMYMDAQEALPSPPLDEAEVSPTGARNDGQIMVFGKSLQEKLGSLNMFLVGAGAIGCEILKIWAMMGVSTGFGKGTTYVTDMDNIEKSNLSRQFLFRNSDIGQMKSATAAKAVTKMNSAFQTVSYESKVAPDTEALFNDDFYESLDCVCAALDNVDARLYLDQRCLFYQRPMLESGTLGSKGHTQVVIPGQTEHYGATRDPPEKSIPLCTLKSFPNQIEHTIQYARDWFEEAYRQTPENANQYIGSTDFLAMLASQQNMKLDTLNKVKEALLDARPRSFDDCIRYARVCFEDKFSNTIKQLLYNLPLDKMTSSGTPFWSGSKMPPSAIGFDAADPLHIEFVLAVAQLRAKVYGVPVADAVTEAAYVASIASQTTVPQFSPQAGAKIALTEEEAKEESKAADPSSVLGVDEECDRIIKMLPPPSEFAEGRLTPVEFDKDIDEHMRVVAAFANLRARNYSIPEADLHRARGIAGKIIPAISTTTAVVSGLVCLELYKIIQNKAREAYRNTYNSLAISMFTSMEPQPPTYVTTKLGDKEWKWSQWDRIDITEPSMTLAQLQKKVEAEYNAELSMLSSGVTILFSAFMAAKKLKERKDMPLKDVVELVTKKPVPSAQKYLIFEMILTDLETDEELEIPYLRFKISP